MKSCPIVPFVDLLFLFVERLFHRVTEAGSEFGVPNRFAGESAVLKCHWICGGNVKKPEQQEKRGNGNIGNCSGEANQRRRHRGERKRDTKTYVGSTSVRRVIIRHETRLFAHYPRRKSFLIENEEELSLA